MRPHSGSFNNSVMDARPQGELTDDGGSGLLAACTARFPAPEFEVECDARRTVWVKRASGTRSFGVAPWAIRQQPLEGVLQDLECKLKKPEKTGKTAA